jgi:hypothetical protein
MTFVCRRHGALPCGQRPGLFCFTSIQSCPAAAGAFLIKANDAGSLSGSGVSSRQCNDTTPDAGDVERNERRSIARAAFFEIRKKRLRVESICAVTLCVASPHAQLASRSRGRTARQTSRRDQGADEGACVYARPRHTGSAAISPTACSSLGHDRS